MKLYNGSYYGSYRTRKFTDIFPDLTSFITEYEDTEALQAFSKQETLSTLYYLLYARYGNSHIAYTDENQFKYGMLSVMFMYGPTWEKRLEVQANIRALSEEDILKGGKAIYNHSFNPSSAPSTGTLDELLTINDQNTTNYKKSKLEGYSMLIDLLDTDVTEEFISKFKKLFIQVLAPDYPLLYEEEN